MTLETTLLQRVPEWRPAPHERASLTFAEQDGPWCARLVADRCDELGIALWELRVDRLAAPLALNDAQLSTWAKSIVESPPLLDPLSIIEIDKTRGNVQIRSEAPTVRNEGKLYYELLLSRAGQASIRRYEAGPESRTEIPFTMTHESLARLATQLMSAAEPFLQAPL
jgi:hypothetical protein